ncbi:MAG: tetratricopeptide repeat-containing protein [Longimicrobiales bacterium]
MRAFIVRPFGTRQTGGDSPIAIDFERVERELIAPALAHHRIHGLTTLEMAAQHNIRVDMFERLVTADIVIADISIHNANVFYELGIRHAIRDHHTFLLRCRGDDVPFDLRTDRYFEYSAADPAATLPALIAALGQTLRSDRRDSPVFQLLPDLEAEDPERFMILPPRFAEAVERAAAVADAGTLALFADEIAGLPWESRGLRVVGRAQFRNSAWEAARTTWESLLLLRPADTEVYLRLGTIYQRLADRTSDSHAKLDLATISDQMLLRVLRLDSAGPWQRAEARALLGRNEKVRWHDAWADRAPEERRIAALESPSLDAAHQHYAHGFREDCNHYYSGLNALALLVSQLELAQAMPAIWTDIAGGEVNAATELERRQTERTRLVGAVDWSIRAAGERESVAGDESFWRAISEADLLLFTTTRPGSVRSAYRRALGRASPLDLDSVDRQLQLYEKIEVLRDNVTAAREAVADRLAQLPTALPGRTAQPDRVLIFTGHRVDAPGRTVPRFPATMEGQVRDAIRVAVEDEVALAVGPVLGMAGAANGGDILFHEVCHSIGLPTRILLALPAHQYQIESVQDGGPEWVERFRDLCDRLPPRVLQPTKQLPDWLLDRPDYSVWQRSNLWLLHSAFAIAGAAAVTLIAFWDGVDRGDGPGGTANMVRIAQSRGAKLRRI